MPSFKLHTTLSRSITLLKWGRWSIAVVLPFLFFVSWSDTPEISVLLLIFGLCLAFALRASELSVRRRFVREAAFPQYLTTKLIEHYPHLSTSDAELVLRGLRQFFMAYLRSGRTFVAMPSKVVDFAWHEYILHTKAYEKWCHAAFGEFLHHSPAEVLGRDGSRNDGLRRVWYWACKEEGIAPRKPSRLPLLFALDKKFAIAGGFIYSTDCSKSYANEHCGTSFGGCGGGGNDTPGDANGFGGSDSSSGGSDGGGGGCGGD